MSTQIDWANEHLSSFSAHAIQNLENKKVAFLVASLGISGGTNFIFQYAQALHASGAHVSIVQTSPIYESKGNWHSGLHGLTVKSISEAKLEKFDLAIVTFWDTMYSAKFLNVDRLLYFVQSLETRFAYNELNPKKARYAEALIAGTYESSFPVVTVASWLQNFLAAQGSRQVWLVPNGIDKEVFPLALTITDLNPEDRLRVLVEGSPNVKMKAVEETLRELSAFKDEISVTWVSPLPQASKQVEGVKVIGPLPMANMRQVYSSHDVLVKMSRVEGMFGPPLEAFHSGMTAVVSRVTGFDEYVTNGHNAICVDVDNFPRMIAAVKYLAENREALADLKKNALSTAEKWPSREETGRLFVAACYAILQSKQDVKKELKKLDKRRKSIDRLHLLGLDPRSGLENYCVVKVGETA